MTRALPPVPIDPAPSDEEIAAELQKHTFGSFMKGEIQRKAAEVFWKGEQRRKLPDMFWHPFAPSGYDAYLRSLEWRRISNRVKSEAGNKCACCPNKATQVHHRCYRPRVMSGEDISLLIALCAACHKTVDFDEHGKVREAHAKERMLAAMFDRESIRLEEGRENGTT